MAEQLASRMANPEDVRHAELLQAALSSHPLAAQADENAEAEAQRLIDSTAEADRAAGSIKVSRAPTGTALVLKLKMIPADGTDPDVRRVTVSGESTFDFDDLCHRAGVSFGPHVEYRFRWLDEDGDLCTITSDEELAEAVAVCNSRITVLVELVKTKTTKTDHAEARPTLASPQLTAPLTLTPQSNTKPTTGERVDTDDISEGSHLSDPIAIQRHALRRETARQKTCT